MRAVHHQTEKFYVCSARDTLARNIVRQRALPSKYFNNTNISDETFSPPWKRTIIMSTHYDAIVIGAGQAGGPLAQAYAKAGRRTALIESTHVGG